MKLSQLSTERAADVLCEISVYAQNILLDDKVRASLKAEKEEAGTKGEKYALGVKKISQWVPMLLKEHREDVLGILAALNDAPVEEIRKQNIMKTAAQIREAVKDRELLDFFRSCAREESV